VFDFIVISSIFTAAFKHFHCGFHWSPQHALLVFLRPQNVVPCSCMVRTMLLLLLVQNLVNSMCASSIYDEFSSIYFFVFSEEFNLCCNCNRFLILCRFLHIMQLPDSFSLEINQMNMSFSLLIPLDV
jgi:hypothetical protein